MRGSHWFWRHPVLGSLQGASWVGSRTVAIVAAVEALRNATPAMAPGL